MAFTSQYLLDSGLSSQLRRASTTVHQAAPMRMVDGLVVNPVVRATPRSQNSKTSLNACFSSFFHTERNPDAMYPMMLKKMSLVEATQFPLDEEYKKKTGITPDQIAELRRWLETQPHLPSEYITDLDLILAFHSCGCSTGVTKQVLDLHFTLHTHFTSFFKDRCFDARTERSLDSILFTPLPTRTEDGYAIFYTYYMDCDAKYFVHTDVIRTMLMVWDLWQYQEGTWPGCVLIVDSANMNLGHLARMEIPNCKNISYYLQEAMFVKLKGIHFINCPAVIDRFMMLLKPFMKKELVDLIRFHLAGAEAAKSLVPVEALPKDCGGSYKTLQECKDDVIAMLRAGESYLKNENLKRVTESLRPGKPKTIADVFGGVEGSFKKLVID